MNKITDSIGANQLIEQLTLEAVNLFYLGGNPDDPEASRLESIIELTAQAWGLPQEATDKSKEIIAAEREATRHEIRGEKSQRAIPPEKILQSDGGDEIMAVLWALFETAIRIDTQEKREQVLQSAKFMAEYLGLEEWVAGPNRTAAERLA